MRRLWASNTNENISEDYGDITKTNECTHWNEEYKTNSVALSPRANYTD
jgi:hypothetical protein